MAAKWGTLKNDRFGSRKYRPDERKKHVAWSGGAVLGTFGPAGEAISLVTGEVFKPSKKIEAKMKKVRRKERRDWVQQQSGDAA